VHAYDEMNGKVLWTTDLPAGSRGIPAMYEVNRKPYLVISATSPVTRGNGHPANVPVPPREFRRAYVTFSLPDTQLPPPKK